MNTRALATNCVILKLKVGATWLCFLFCLSAQPGLFGVTDPPVLAGCQFHVSVHHLNKWKHSLVMSSVLCEFLKEAQHRAVWSHTHYMVANWFQSNYWRKLSMLFVLIFYRIKEASSSLIFRVMPEQPKSKYYIELRNLYIYNKKWTQQQILQIYLSNIKDFVNVYLQLKNWYYLLCSNILLKCCTWFLSLWLI